MKLYPPRDYQHDQLNFLRAYNGCNICIQSPTGTGKSNLIAHRVNQHLNNQERVLILAPKQELCDNILQNMSDVATVAYSGVDPLLSRKVLITTPQSAAKHLKRFKPTRIIADECHHVIANNQSALISGLNLPLEGFTATPNRLDGKGLYTHFKRLSVAPSIKWFIDQNYLSKFELITSKAPLFETSKGDALGEQQNIFIPHIKDSVAHWMQVARSLKTLVFCATIKHADLMLQEFLNSGIKAAVIHSGNAKHREPILRAFETGRIQVLVNVEFATEGVNIPDIQCVMLCRFTYSTALYLQMVGRLLRFISEWQIKLILDLANNSYYHGAVDTPFNWSLEGQSFKAKSNQDSIQNRCIKCGTILCHKKSVIEDALVSCLQCREINHVVVIRSTQKDVKGAAIHQVFSVEDLHRITDTSVTELTRILLGSNKKRFSKEAKISAICDLDIEFDLKKKALKYVGLTDREFDLYFGD